MRRARRAPAPVIVARRSSFWGEGRAERGVGRSGEQRVSGYNRFSFPFCGVLFHTKLIGAAQGYKSCGMTAVRANISLLLGCGFQLTFLKFGVQDEYGKVR